LKVFLNLLILGIPSIIQAYVEDLVTAIQNLKGSSFLSLSKRSLAEGDYSFENRQVLGQAAFDLADQMGMVAA
jgi:hypothetical protein